MSIRIRDVRGLSIVLTEERLDHIVESHPELADAKRLIEETLGAPETIVESVSDARVNLYYRYYYATVVGDKHVCMVVHTAPKPFVLTAYLTDRVKKGTIVWPVG